MRHYCISRSCQPSHKDTILYEYCAGPLVVDALRPLTDAPLDTHLMIVEPEQRVGRLCHHKHWLCGPVRAAQCTLRYSLCLWVHKIVPVCFFPGHAVRSMTAVKKRCITRRPRWYKEVSQPRVELHFAGDFIKAGSDIVSVHAEQASTIHLHRVVNMVSLPSRVYCLICHCQPGISRGLQ